VTDEPLIEIRRSRRSFVSRSIDTYGPVVVAAIIGSIIFGDLRSRILVTVIVLLLGLGLSVFSHRRARVFVGTTRLGRRGWLGTWWMTRADLERGLLLERLVGRDGKKTRELFLFDPAGARVARFSGGVWGNKNVDRIAHALALPMTTVDRAVSLKELPALEPRSLSFVERHHYVVLFGALAVALGLVFAVVAISTSQPFG